MVTQSTTVVLQANVAGYIASLQSAAAATTNFANQGAAAVTHHQQSWDNAAKKMGAVGLGMAAGVGVVVKSYADFDKAMSAVKANVEATPAEFQKLSDSVRSAGTQFGFSAKESAAGAEELAKAGLSASQIMGGSLTGALTLAAAGEVSVGEAAETAATAMSMFGLEAKDVSRIADVLANGANQSTASVGSLSQALRQGGGVAASFGISLEDTVATLAMFDQNGLKGSDAGTSLKTMLTALANPSKKAAEAMEELGIQTFDASGKFIGMAGLQSELKTKMAGLTQEQRAQAMATIFGSDAMRAANVLFKDTRGMEDWSAGIRKAGTAAENAETRLDNLYGDLNKLKSAFLDAAIGSGSGGDGFLRPVIQGATSALSAINALPGPVKSVGFGLTAATAAALLIGAGLMKLISIAASVRAGIATAGPWAAAAAAVLAAAVAFDKLGEAMSTLPNTSVEDARAQIAGLSKEGQSLKGALNVSTSSVNGLGKALSYVVLPTRMFGGGLKDSKKAVESYDSALAQMVSGGKQQEAAKWLKEQGISASQAAKSLPQYSDALKKAKTDAAEAKTPTKQMAEAISGVSDEADQARDDVDALARAIKGMGSTFLDEQNGAMGYQDALSKVAKSLQENGRNSNIATEGGRQNSKALQDLATQTRDWAAAVYVQTGSVADADGVLQSGRAQVEAFGKSMGFTKPQIDALTKSVMTLEANGSPKITPTIPGIESVTTKVNELGLRVYAIKGTNITIPVDAPGAKTVVEALASVRGARMNADGSVTITASANTTETMQNLRSVRGARIDANGNVTIDTRTLNADPTIATLDAIATRVRNRAQYITTYFNSVQLGPGTAISPKPGTTRLPGMEYRSNADGGVQRGGHWYMAQGGIRDRAAMIAKAGSWVTWAEDETGDEAYIPLGRAKRPRSRRIADETVRRLGGQVTWMADGGITGNSWSPNMSGIMSLIQGFTYDNEKTAYDKFYDQRAALQKLNRDLAAARQKLAEDQKRKGVPASRIIADQNRILDLTNKQAAAQRSLNDLNSKYTAIKTARGQSAASQFNAAAGQTNSISKKFLTDLATIEKRGFPMLARSLGEQGDEDAQRIAASFASSPLGTLRQAESGLKESDANKAALDKMLGRLSGNAGPSALAENQAARLAANQHLVAIQAANNSWARGGGVQTVRVDVDYNQVIDGVARRLQVDVRPAPMSVNLDGRTVATSTTQYQAQQASYGSTRPGVE
ncbi:phage tail tape measure protein [Yimella sp. cx-573]|nr:phage tail tape measure protein [Yimella sp. cx-573]